MTVFITGILAVTFFTGFLTRDRLAPVENPEHEEATQTNHDLKGRQDNDLTSGEYIVSKVLDGDTIDLTNGVRIRYEGIDAPEKNESYGLDALNDNQQLVDGKKIRIEVAENSTDGFGRTLAYVWSDNVFVNERLVEDGYARVYVHFPTRPPKYLKQLQEAQTRAMQDGWGMWVEEKVNN